eukprot:4731928-Amphidinium_carterae.1
MMHRYDMMAQGAWCLRARHKTSIKGVCFSEGPTFTMGSVALTTKMSNKECVSMASHSFCVRWGSINGHQAGLSHLHAHIEIDTKVKVPRLDQVIDLHIAWQSGHIFLSEA